MPENGLQHFAAFMHRTVKISETRVIIFCKIIFLSLLQFFGASKIYYSPRRQRMRNTNAEGIPYIYTGGRLLQIPGIFQY